MNNLDLIYELAPRLEKFKKQSATTFNFRCPICGDSSKNKSKARGFFLLKGDRATFYCHNGCKPRSLANFTKEVFPDVYKQFLFSKYENWAASDEPLQAISEEEKPSVFPDKFPEVFVRLTSLPIDHVARRYVADRKIPELYVRKMWYSDNFKADVNKIVSGKFSSLYMDEPRIVIPTFDDSGLMVSFIGRSLSGSDPKYINIKFDPDDQPIFNMEMVNLSKRFYAVEGQIDCMFVDNSVGIGGIKKVGGFLTQYKNNVVICLDNDSRNAQVVCAISKYIDSGHFVFIWPKDFPYKDFNDCVVKGGMDSESIMQMIRDRTFKGLTAKLELGEWKKVDVQCR